MAQVFITLQMNKVYKQIAQRTTENENHQTKSSFNNSLIVKRVVFEFCNYFTHLFYVGFVQRNIPGLQKELVALFMIDEIRRLMSESVIPYYKGKAKKQLNREKKKSLSEKEKIEQEELAELELEEFSPFDDYLEMIMQFGYITLFAGMISFAF